MPTAKAYTFEDGSEWWAESKHLGGEPVVCVPVSAIENLDALTLIDHLHKAKDAALLAEASFIASMILYRPQDALRIVEEENPDSNYLLLRYRADDPEVDSAYKIYQHELNARIERQKNGKESKAKRAQIFSQRTSLLAELNERDGGMFCQQCRATEHLCIDHITPLIRGGSNDLDNLQILCKSCNSRKGDK